MLPVPEEYYDDDMQFVIDEEYFDFSGNEYEGTELDEETEVEEGDFLAFYSENKDTVLRYGRIREVENADGSYDITFEPMDLEEIQASMDLYDSRDVDADQLLSDEEIAELERSIEQQAFSSGFVDEAASYLAGMALETEEVKRQMGPGLFANRASSRVSIENNQIKANLSRNLQHFQGKSGVRCALQVTCTVKVKCSNGVELRMKLTGIFTEEVRLAINVSSKTIWKWKWIFPYIYDYKLNANLDVYNFTAIDVQATMASKSPSQKWGDPGTQEYDIAQEIKKLMDAGKYQSEAIEGGVQKMTDRYHAMLQQESDGVTLFDQKIFSTKGAVDPFHILAYGVNCSFVTRANLNVSLGCAFEYEIGRRYSYVVELFHKKATSNTINLVDERYELEFYVMGTMGLRAGIRLEVELGLFSTTLDSVGISAEIGAYVRMWGYFYYHLAHTGRGGTVSQSSGALLTELGIYLEISFKAQVLNGRFQHEEKLYNREWPLWSAGVQQNVYGFADTRVPTVDIRRSIKTYHLSDDIFKMNQMDLKTGKASVRQYDDRSDFIISFTNRAFSYNPNTNTIMVSSSRPIEVGEMIITWKRQAAAFSSKPLTRKIKLHWDDLADSYTIRFQSNGGSAVPPISQKYGTRISPPAACETAGTRERSCQFCLKKETEAVPELGHDYSQEWTIDQESTCTEDGEKSHHCLRCSSRIDITVIVKTGHTYPAGSEFCSVCGYRNVIADTSWYNENDSKFSLNSEGQLMGLAELVNSGNSFSGKTITLEKDLDLTAIPWVPIGNSSSHFSGIFDGGYHIISNLTIVSGGNCSGLFGETYNAKIKAAGVSGVSVTAEESKELGGLIGRDNGGTEIKECFVTGSITGEGCIGGIVGATRGSSNPTRINDCYTRMTLHGDGTTLDVSGISGWNDSNSILIVNSYTASTGEKRPIAGWSDGAAVADMLVINSWYDKTLSSTAHGLVSFGKITEELKQKETYGSWDFDGIWSIEAGVNQGYPVLKQYMIK